MANTSPNRLEAMREKARSEHAVGLVKKLDELGASNLRMEDEQKEVQKHVNDIFEKHWKDPMWKSELAVFAGSRGCEDSRRDSIRRGYFSSFLHLLQERKLSGGQEKKK